MFEKLKKLATWCWHKLRAFFPWYKKLYKGHAWYTKGLIGFVSFIIVLFLYLGAVDINFLWLFGKSPGFRKLCIPILPKHLRYTVPTANLSANTSMKTEHP